MSAQLDMADGKIPQWVWLAIGGLGGLLLVGAAVSWIIRGSAILLDMADFFCL